MLDRWYKVATIAIAVVAIVSAIVGPTIGGIYWLAQLDSDVTRLQTEVKELKTDIAELQKGQEAILEILRELADDMPEIRADLNNHTHNSDGQAQFTGT